MKNLTSLPSASLGPLADILGSPFHINVSSDDALLVQTTTGDEFPLSLLSRQESREILDRACDQYVASVLTGCSSIDQDRATLFFISGYCDRHSGVVAKRDKPGRNRSTGRRPVSRPSGLAKTTSQRSLSLAS